MGDVVATQTLRTPQSPKLALLLCLSCAPEVKEDEEGRERERG